MDRDQTSSPQIFASDGTPLSAEAVLVQLAKTLSSQPFQASRRLTSFLSFVVEETLAGRSEQLKEYVIAVNAMERPSGFDPQFDPAVRIQAGRLRTALDRYFHGEGTSDPLRIDMPKGAYVPVFHLNSGAADKPGPHLDTAISANPRGIDSPTLGPTIAVITFANLNPDDSRDYFSVGFTESLAAQLSQFGGIHVVGPLASLDGAAKTLDFSHIGQRYGAHFVLHGSIRWQNETIRITANLVDPTTSETIWAKSFDGSLDGASMFEIEDDIIGRISGLIADYSGVIHRKPRRMVQPDADGFTVYDAIMRYYGLLDRMDSTRFQPTIQTLQHAHTLEPENPLVLAMLAEMHALDYMHNIGLLKDRLDNAEKLARQAISLDPANQHARAVLAEVYFLRGQGNSCRAELAHLLALNPAHPSFIYFCGVGFAMLGEWTRGIELVQQAIRLNPHYPGYYHFVFFMNEYRQGNAEAALVEARRVDTPGTIVGPLSRAVALAQLGRFSEAQAELSEVHSITPDFDARKAALIRRQVFTNTNVEMLLEGLDAIDLWLSAKSEAGCEQEV